jgi:hypothetical protein
MLLDAAWARHIAPIEKMMRREAHEIISAIADGYRSKIGQEADEAQ